MIRGRGVLNVVVTHGMRNLQNLMKMAWWIQNKMTQRDDRLKLLAKLREIRAAEVAKGTQELEIRAILDKHLKSLGFSYNSRLDYLNMVMED